VKFIFKIATTRSSLKPSHMRNIFRRGVKNEADIYEVLPSFKSQMLGDKLEMFRKTISAARNVSSYSNNNNVVIPEVLLQ
jgi:hypothetical protein